ncbi:hypothetical protein JCM15457_1565 [Liquorilactobacillus sucicola DSM 21376 = JCM 15457]|nr:hypothetical protein JCM15457_1565 [Liquorilactobacillus sucicola DSM 21376 = JCM 15457]
MERKLKKVKTPYGEVGVKELTYHGVKKFSVEYDDLMKCSQKTAEEPEKIRLAALQEIENKGE